MIPNIILHLTLIKNVGLVALHNIIEKIGVRKIPDLYQWTVQDFVNCSVDADTAALLVAGLSNLDLLNKELELIQQHNVKIVTLFCDQYPSLLKQIHVPPLVLYCQGDVSLFAEQKTISCVGARKANLYVQDVLLHVIVPMIEQGWVIVSGGALGADTFAHQIALKQQGKTIIVVGSGLCYQYPPQNKPLFDRVVHEGGLIVSAFSMQTPPEPRCFPQRNRIIAGLSQGCLVLQAAQKSGALITAQCALDQGRDVFAIPGSIFDPLSAGCHDLIAQGAKLVQSTQDILQELGYADQPVQRQLFRLATITEKIERNPIHEQILYHCVTAITADYLLSKMKIDMSSLQEALFFLSLEGKIEQDAMGFWKRL